MNSKEAILIVVNQLGSQKKLAEKLHVSRTTVSMWAIGHRNVPANRVMDIVKLSKGKIKAKDLRPDVFKNNSEAI